MKTFETAVFVVGAGPSDLTTIAFVSERGKEAVVGTCAGGELQRGLFCRRAPRVSTVSALMAPADIIIDRASSRCTAQAARAGRAAARRRSLSSPRQSSSATTRQGIKNTISPGGNVGERARHRLRLFRGDGLSGVSQPLGRLQRNRGKNGGDAIRAHDSDDPTCLSPFI
jgi:hypothetical protein